MYIETLITPKFKLHTDAFNIMFIPLIFYAIIIMNRPLDTSSVYSIY